MANRIGNGGKSAWHYFKFLFIYLFLVVCLQATADNWSHEIKNAYSLEGKLSQSRQHIKKQKH